MKTRLGGERSFRRFALITLGIMTILSLLPVILIVIASFTDENSLIANGYSYFPAKWSLDAYFYMVKQVKLITRAYGISFFVTITGTLLSVLFTTTLAYPMSRKDFKFSKILTFLVFFTMLFNGGVVPSYMMWSQFFHLKNTIWALILPSVFSVWNMFLLRTYFSAISPSLYEAAILDGANYFQIFWRITVPLSKTTLLTVGMMYALAFWNDWWNALMFINSKDLFPLQYYLYNILSNVNAVSSGRIPAGASGIQLPAETVKMAVTMITIGPIIFLYPFVQKYFVNGIMTGAVKE